MKKTIKLSELRDVKKDEVINLEVNGKTLEVIIKAPTEEDYSFVANSIDEKYSSAKVINYMIENMTNIEIDIDINDNNKLPIMELLNYAAIIGRLKELYMEMIKDISKCIDIYEYKNKKEK